jgi:uncharacterized protein
VLALNAGKGVAGPFLDTDLERDLALIQLNIGSVIHLVEALAASHGDPWRGSGVDHVVDRRDNAGAVLRDVRGVEGLSVVLRRGAPPRAQGHRRHRYGVAAGPTDTEFFDRAGMHNTPVNEERKDDPGEVARDAFKALMAGDDKVVSGSVKNLLQSIAARLTPEQFKAARHAAQTKPKELE